jgi:hypothetical protein
MDDETSAPECSAHDPPLKNVCDRTAEMRWIEHVKTDPPEWMRHDPSLKDVFPEMPTIV